VARDWRGPSTAETFFFLHYFFIKNNHVSIGVNRFLIRTCLILVKFMLIYFNNKFHVELFFYLGDDIYFK